jgi:hypothetical protein
MRILVQRTVFMLSGVLARLLLLMVPLILTICLLQVVAVEETLAHGMNVEAAAVLAV